VTWDECLADLAARLRVMIDSHGADSVARYTGTSVMSDFAAGWGNVALFDKLGSKQCYSSATVDIVPLWKAAELVTGFPREAAPVWDPENSPDVCVVIGHNPVVSHGYWGLFLADPIRRIREFTRRGGQLFVLDPRRSETAALATEHIRLRPDTDALVLAWLVRELLRVGYDANEITNHVDPVDVACLREAVEPFDLDTVASRTGVACETLERLLAAVRRSGRIACVSGTGISFGRHGLVTEWLRWALLILTGSLDVDGGMRFRTGFLAPVNRRPTLNPAPPEGNSEPGPATNPRLPRWLGEYPSVALVPEIEAGNVRALLVLGGNPLTAFPDPDRTRRALASLETLVAVDVVETEITAMATHVLPAADVLEHADLAVRDRGVFVPRVVAPTAERRPQWWILAQLAKRLGVDLLGELDPDRADDVDVLRFIASRAGSDTTALEAAPLTPVEPAPETGWVRQRMLPNGRWRIAPRQLVARLPELLDSEPSGTFVLVSRRVGRSVNSALYGSGRGPEDDAATIHVHPDDVQERALVAGDVARVVSTHGEVEAVVEADGALARGVVSLTHGRLAANVARLVSGTTDVDPLTGQPRMTGLPVEVVPALRSWPHSD
jgi:anaerobic selenocysteine-containing dehydrogenase